jgi:hypothetical protein
VALIAGAQPFAGPVARGFLVYSPDGGGCTMSGRRSGDKSTCIERASACVVQWQGVAAANIGRMYKPVAERSMSFLSSDTTIEVKRRATGFAQLYDRLNKRDMIVKADRQEPSVVLRMSLAAEIAKRMV